MGRFIPSENLCKKLLSNSDISTNSLMDFIFSVPVRAFYERRFLNIRILTRPREPSLLFRRSLFRKSSGSEKSRHTIPRPVR